MAECVIFLLQNKQKLCLVSHHEQENTLTTYLLHAILFDAKGQKEGIFLQVDACIKGRRSVRTYSDRKISTDLFAEIVDLARFSPSWKNTQVVRYHVIKNAHIKEKIAKECVLGFAFNEKTIIRCQALVVVSVVTGVSGYEKDGSYSTPQEDRWEMFDAGIASQTFCLAAHSRGIGSVILGVFEEEKLRQYIDLPQNQRVTNLIALGYPQQPAKSGPPRKAISELLDIVE